MFYPADELWNLLRNGSMQRVIIFTEPGVPEETAKTVWDRMVFSFDLAGASLILYNNETPLVS